MQYLVQMREVKQYGVTPWEVYKTDKDLTERESFDLADEIEDNSNTNIECRCVMQHTVLNKRKAIQ